MAYDPRRSKFTLVNGGLQDASIEGPVTRLGLRNRFQPISNRAWTLMILTKVAAVASILYYYFG